ncbi:MAG: hypothetical protein HYV63_27905 [Candidatus Schekmanbacteria bacterium]|nr:hypothetical protein [Candidatus Schekmanbacteria bacterium]
MMAADGAARVGRLLGMMAAALVAVACSIGGATADSGRGFTFLGRLARFGEPLSGLCDLKFSLYDAETDGRQLGAAVMRATVPIERGRFQVDLDFGAASFEQSPRWLEIVADCPAGDGAPVTLSPRQRVDYAAPTPLQLLEGTAVFSPPRRGECARDSDCPAGTCVRIPDDPGGWHTCSTFIAKELAACPPDTASSGCCQSRDCSSGTNGGCFPAAMWHCGGAAPPVHSRCVYDECSRDSDCVEKDQGLCVVAGAFGEVRNRCVYGQCRLDSDCREQPEGSCRPFLAPCNHRLVGFHCTYPDSACREDADCAKAGADYCAPGENGAPECRTFHPPL